MFVTCGCVVRSALCMLAMHKLTLGAPLHVSRSSQDATPAVTGSVTGSMYLTAGAELLCAAQKSNFACDSCLPPEFLQVCVTQ